MPKQQRRERRLTVVSKQREWTAQSLSPVIAVYVLHRLSERNADARSKNASAESAP
jgi:hypothetical protein